MEVIVSLLTNKSTTHKGRFFELTDAWCEPKPVQARIPIVIGGKGKLRTLRTVAKYADQWDMTFPDTPADWLELDEALRGHCEKLGRDHSEIARSVHLGFDESPAEQLAEKAQSFFEAGVDIVVWSMRGPVEAARLAPFAEALTA